MRWKLQKFMFNTIGTIVICCTDGSDKHVVNNTCEFFFYKTRFFKSQTLCLRHGNVIAVSTDIIFRNCFGGESNDVLLFRQGLEDHRDSRMAIISISSFSSSESERSESQSSSNRNADTFTQPPIGLICNVRLEEEVLLRRIRAHAMALLDAR